MGPVIVQHLDALLEMRMIWVVLREDKSDLVLEMPKLALQRDPPLLHVGDASQGFSVLDYPL